MLSEDIHQAMRRDIIRCVLEPGGYVSETELCVRYGVGKAPVRIALLRLGQEGLVRSVPRRGYEVAPITVRDVEEVFQMRLMLEPAAARLAIERCSKDELALLRRFDVDARAVDLSEFLGAGMLRNREFHLAIAQFSGNDRLVRTLARLLDEAERVLHLWLSREGEQAHGILREEGEHSAIVETLMSGDPEAAERALCEHLRVAKEAILDSIVSRRSVLDLRIGRAG
jgi:DNA-binding GntR family transcriptional regulator